MSRDGGRLLPGVREDIEDDDEDGGTPSAARAVEERARDAGLDRLGSSWRSQMPAVDWLRATRSRLLPASVGVGGRGGIAKAFLRLVGVGGVMPVASVEPLLEPDPARVPALDAGRRKPEARDVLRLPTSSQAQTSSSAI